jgi:hypothetical protein
MQRNRLNDTSMNCSGKNTGNFNRIDYRIALDETALDGTIEDDTIDNTRIRVDTTLDDTK